MDARSPDPATAQDSMMTDLIPDFANCYERYFKVLKADTPHLLDQVFRLRYQVYCVENPFEDPAEHLDGREIDEYDEHSAHVLLVHRDSSAAIGTARVILPRQDDGPGDGSEPLPIQRVLEPHDRQAFERLPLRRTAEISRLAVGKALRHHWWSKSAARPAASDMSRELLTNEKLLTRYITFGLLRGILDTCMENAILYLAAVMEPALIRALTRFGLEFEPIGGRVDYHGIRQPCVARLTNLIDRVRSHHTLLWQYVSTAAGL
jgi:N-acyl amino acid synthase of PEP-CTERM/exosortase system